MAAKAKRARILLVDDSPDTLEVLERNLTHCGFDVHTALSAGAALDFLTGHAVELLITDVKMPGMSGMDLLRLVRDEHPELQVMMITGYATIEGAVAAVKTGAEEYLAKPFTAEELLAAVNRALSKRRAPQAQTTRTLPHRLGLLGSSEGMRRAFDAMERAAASDAPVLLLGEPGTGRESAARAIHRVGSRGGSAFIALNCETVPPDLLAGEVLRALDLARGGTLYLRAIECAPAEAVHAVGGSLAAGDTEARVVASSDPEFTSMVGRGLLPEHLSTFLKWQVIVLPPLRERGSDLLLLAEHVVREGSQSLGRPAPVLSEALRQVLRAYPWPGNVGELRTVLLKAARECSADTLDVRHVPSPLRNAAPPGARLPRPLAEVETEYIREVLARVEGNKSRAADLLGIDRKTLREKLR